MTYLRKLLVTQLLRLRSILLRLSRNTSVGLAVLLNILVNKNQRSGPENFLRLLRTLQSVHPEQL